MFGIKSKVLNATLAASFAIPLATAGMSISAGSAQAAALYGGFNFGPAGIPPSELTISNTSIAFDPTPGLLSLSLQTGSFQTLGFNAANIFNNTTNPLTVGSTLLDLGQYANLSTLNDGNNTFKLTSFGSIDLKSEVAGLTNGSLGFFGYFDDGLGNTTAAKGTISFVAQDTLENVQAALATTNGVKASFTGAALTTVPEPTTLLGLGAIGAAMAVSRRRKAQVSS
jgi:hypothetical protein